MKFLYAGFVSESEQYSGILKKVAGQTKGVAGLGWEAHYTFVSECGVVLETGSGRKEKTFAPNLRWRAKRRAVTEKICEFLADGSYDVIYIKGMLTTPYDLRLAKYANASKKGCKVIFEVATYPFWSSYLRLLRSDARNRNTRSFAGHILEIFQHAATFFRLKKYVDALVVFGTPVRRLWGIPAITVDNGVSLGSVGLRKKPVASAADPIRLLGVMGTTVSHGYSRLLEGLAAYTEKPGDPGIHFDIAGENDTSGALKAQVSELRLENKVSFLGYRNSEQLAELYNRCDAAVSVLGGYQFGLTHLSPLKSREYCAAGIPFLYAYEDTLLSGGEPFALKLPNDASPVDMNAVAAFVRKCREDPGLPERERKFAEQNCDWKSIMKRILEFAEQADRL